MVEILPETLLPTVVVAVEALMADHQARALPPPASVEKMEAMVPAVAVVAPLVPGVLRQLQAPLAAAAPDHLVKIQSIPMRGAPADATQHSMPRMGHVAAEVVLDLLPRRLIRAVEQVVPVARMAAAAAAQDIPMRKMGRQ
jgi:hypothetical protein